MSKLFRKTLGSITTLHNRVSKPKGRAVTPFTKGKLFCNHQKVNCVDFPKNWPI